LLSSIGSSINWSSPKHLNDISELRDDRVCPDPGDCSRYWTSSGFVMLYYIVQ
jgi:hypothetical protein